MADDTVIATIEIGTLSSIHNADDIAKLKSANITPEDFHLYSDVLAFFYQFFERYKKIPSANVLAGRWPELQLIEPDEALGYYIDLLLQHSMFTHAQQVLAKHIPNLLAEPAETIMALSESLRKCVRTPFSTVSYTDGDALDRAGEYVERSILVAEKGTIGIPTGFETFDRMFGGWQPGMLVGIIGRPKLGKSWLLLHIGCTAYKTGKRILFLSPEMPVREVEARWDTVMGHFSNMALNQGKDIDVRQYREFLTKMAKRKDWITASCHEGSPFNVSIIESLIRRHHPDLVCVDGLPLLQDVERAEQSWLKMYNIAYGLKQIAITCNVPIIATSQAGRQVQNTKLPKLADIVLGDAVGQACDYVISMALPQGSSKYRQVAVQAARRSNVGKPFIITFNVNAGEIGEVTNVFNEAIQLLEGEEGLG